LYNNNDAIVVNVDCDGKKGIVNIGPRKWISLISEKPIVGMGRSDQQLGHMGEGIVQ
jgi:hypothetical protein